MIDRSLINPTYEKTKSDLRLELFHCFILG